MSFVAVAIGGSAIAGLGGAYMSSQAATEASRTQANATQSALDFQKQAYDKNQQNLQPYLDAGRGATYRLSQLTGTGSNSTPDFSQFYKSPDYQFRQQQGELGIERAANARGMNLSGGTLKDLATFNSGLASTEYGNYFSRLMDLSKMGSGTAGNLANSNAGMSGAIGNTTMGLGQANASGIVGSANAWSGGVNNIGNNAIMAAALGRNPSAYGNGPGEGWDSYGGVTFPKIGNWGS